MTAKEVRDQVVTIFMAGHETTAQALSWTFYLLSQHPDVERNCMTSLRPCLPVARRIMRISRNYATRAW